MSDRLAIAGGCGSSGTTLLAHLVSRHPDIASGPEFNCFNHPEVYDLGGLRRALPRLLSGRARPAGYVDVPVFMTFRDHYQISDELIRNWTECSQDAGEFVTRVTDHVLGHLGGRLFFEKSPTNVYCMLAASRTLPGTPLVHLVRDGRDVAVSLMRRGWNLFGAGSRWLYDTLRGLEARQAQHYLELRYEELVTSPDEQLDRILRHLGIEGSGHSLTQPPTNATGLYSEDWTARSEPKAWTQTPADPISPKSIGRFKTALSSRDIATLCRIQLAASVQLSTHLPRNFGDLLDFLGYTSSDSAALHRPRPLDRVTYQLGDYARRVRRFQSRRSWQLPTRYTRFR